MPRTNTNYDKQFTESPVADSYLNDTPSVIIPRNKKIINNPNITLGNISTPSVSTNQDILSYFDQRSVLKNLPYYTSHNVEDKSVNPAIMQKGIQTGRANWVDSLTSNIRQLMKSADIDKIAEIDNQIYLNNKQIKENPNLTEKELLEITVQNKILDNNKRKLDQKIENRDKKIDENSPDLIYQIKAMQMQEDEATGVPFSSSEFGMFEGLKNYFGYEAPQDIAGSLTTAWAMAASISPQILRSVGAKALAKAGIPLPGGRWVSAAWAATELATIMATQYKAREIETRMEAGSAYTEKLEGLIKDFQKTTGQYPNENQLAELKNQAYQGIDSLKKANMILWGEDAVQMALMAMPWTKTIRNAFSLSKYGAASAGLIGLGFQSFGEMIEEGYQGNVQDDYNKGVIPDDVDLSYFWDTTTKTAKGIFGITGDSEYMNSAEFRNAVRSGGAMGLLFGAGPSVIGSVNSVRKYSKDQRLLKDLIELDIESEKTQYRQSVYSNVYNNGTQERTINILESIKNTKYAEDNNITSEEIDLEIELAKKAFSLYDYVNNNKLTNELNEIEKQQVVSSMINLNSNISTAKDNINEHNDYINNIYSLENEVLSVKGQEFRTLNQLKNRVTAIQTKLDKLDEHKNDSLRSSLPYKKYLQVELSKVVKELETGLETSKLKESDLILPNDDGIIHYELLNLDNEYQIKESEQLYSWLSKPKNVIDFINKAREKVEINKEEKAKRKEEEIKRAEEESSLTKVKDNKGNKYVYAGKEGNRFTFLNQETKELETFTKEEVDENKMVEESTGQPITKKPTLLTNKESEEYLFLGKADDKFRLQNLNTGKINILSLNEINQLDIVSPDNIKIDDWVPGSLIDLLDETNNEYKEFKDKLEEARKDIEDAIQSFKNREVEKTKEDLFSDNAEEDLKKFSNYYGSPALSQLTYEELFNQESVYKIIPIIKDTIIGYMELQDDNTITFTDDLDNTSTIGKLNDFLEVRDYGITVLKNFIFNLEISTDGNTFIIENDSYNVDQTNAFSAIKEDNEGNPISITLKRKSDNKNVTFTNRTVVNELAAALALISEAKVEIINKQKDVDSDFIIVTDPLSLTGKEYQVYERDGDWVVVNPSNKKPLRKGLTSKRILNKFHSEAQKNIERLEVILEELNQNNELTKTNIQNELERINNGIRSATAKEVNDTKSSSELQDVKKEKDQEVEQTNESEKLGQKAEEILILNKADELANEKTQELISNIDSTALLEIDNEPQEILNEDEGPGFHGSNYLETTKGIFDVATAVAWSANVDKEFNRYVSNVDLKVNNWSGTYKIDFDNEWFDNHPELKSKLQHGEYVDLTASSDSQFYDIVDEIPIEMVIKDDKGNIVPGKKKFYHKSNYQNIFIPEDITEDHKIAEYRIEHKRHVRAHRNEILTNLMSNVEVTVSKFERHRGITNNDPKDDPNRNKSLFKVFPRTKHWTLGIGDIHNRIRKAQKKLMVNKDGKPFKGPTSSIFAEINETLNGEVFALKLNTSKLSIEHANILFKAMVTAYSPKSGGYSSLYPGQEVSNLNVGEVIEYLVLEGENFTKQSLKDNPKPYLLSKQLYGKNNKIYYGENETVLDPINYTEEEKNKFIQWVHNNKNYNIINNKLGSTLKGDFKIGKIEGKRNQKYDDFIVLNSLVLTDLNAEMPFTSPVISFEKTTFKTKIEKRNEKATEELNKVAESRKEITNLEDEKAKEIKNIEQSEDIKKINDEISKIEDNKESTPEDIEKAEELKTNRNILADEKKKEIEETYNPKLDKLKKEAPKKPKLPSGYDLLNEVGKDIAPFRSREWAPEHYIPADIESEIKWLNDRFSGLSNQVVKDMIKMGDGHAFSTINDYGIILSEAAEEGSVYHEAFHWVSLGFLNNEQRAKLYDEAREQYNLGLMSDELVEEELAEKFREFVLNENKKAFDIKGTIKAFFNRIWAWLSSFWATTPKLGDLSIERLFEAINNKEYKYSTKVNTIVGEKARLQSRDYIKRKTGFTTDNIKEWVSNIQFLAFNLNKIDSIENVDRIDFEVVKEKIIEYRDQYEAGLEVIDESQEYMENIARLIEVYDAVINNFSDFQKLVEDHLASLKIFRVDKGENYMNQFKSSYESSAKDNMLSSIKMLIMTLPESKDRSKFSNLYSFVEFDSFWNKLMYDLHSLGTIKEMMDKIKIKSNTVFPYTVLYNKLQNDELLKTQFEVSIKKTRHRFVNVLYNITNKKPTFTFANADVQKAVTAYINEWGQNFADSNLFNSKNELSKEKIIELNNRYKIVLNDVEKYNNEGKLDNYNEIVDELVSMLNELSIPLDVNTINNMVASRPNILNMDEGLRSFITDDINYLFSDKSVLYKKANIGKYVVNKQEVSNENLFKYESQIKGLAEYYTYSKPEDMTVTVLGPGGNPYYVYSEHSYITSTINKINNDDNLEWINSKLSAEYNKNSYLLNQLKNNEDLRKNIKIETFSGFIQTNAKDQGRKYSKLSDTEDFLFKLAAIHNGHTRKDGNLKKGKLPMPTLADRTTHQFYTGIDLLDYQFNINKEGRLINPINSEVIETFIGYAKDENNRVNLVKKQIDEAVKNKDTRKLVENLHYHVSKDNEQAELFEKVDRNVFKIFKNKHGKYVGNGTRFHYFKEFNNKQFSTDNETLRKAVTIFIRDNVWDTIKFAGELGIIDVKIEKDGRPIIIDNNLIDQELVDNIAKREFNGDKNKALQKILANFSVNTMMSTIETEKLFLGDPSFYKYDKKIQSTRKDKVKRSSMIMSTGEELRSDFPSDHEFHGRKTFNVSILATDKIGSVYYSEIYNKYVELLKLEGYSNNESERIAKSKLSAYKSGIDPSDAQVFVTGPMYRELSIKYGNWSKDQQNAYDLLMSDRFLEPHEEHTAMKISMSPLKLLYFGNSIENGLDIPTIDKMSIAPLFRRITKNTDLDNLLDRMLLEGKYKDKGMISIDYIKFDSAIKAGAREKHNYYTNNDYKQPVDFNDKDLVVFQQDFDSLRRQQTIEAHDVTHITLGTQLKKIVMANVVKDSTYSIGNESITGEELLKDINGTLSKLSNIGKERLLNQLGTDPETGKIGDPTKLATMLTKDASKSNATDNTLNALSIDETTGKPYMRFDALPNRKEIENRLLSLITKETVDLNMPGNSFVQMTNFGIANSLKFYRTEGNKTLPMESMVSVNLFKKVIPNYENLTWEEKRKFVQEMQPKLIGYRIPTSGQSSTFSMIVTDILPEQIGDTIILPAEAVSLAGFDFDIDKLYVARYNYEITDDTSTKIEYSEDNKDTREALENRLLDAYFAILEDSKHFISTITPLDTATGILKDKIIPEIRGLEGKESSYNWSGYELSPRFQASVKSEYTGGDDGIKSYAIGNVHHILGQIVGLGLKADIGIGHNNPSANYTKLSEIKDKEKTGDEYMYITDWFNGLANAHLDIAKDSYIYEANVNSDTHNLVNLLIRAGVGEKTFFFLSQPILKDYVKESRLQSGELKVISGKPLSIVRKRWENKMTDNNQNSKATDRSEDEIWNMSRLKKDIDKNTNHNTEFYKRQLQILDTFKELNEYAYFLNNAVSVSRIDTPKYKNLVEVKGILNKMNKVISDNMIDKFDELYTETFLGVIFNNSIKLAGDLFRNKTITATDSFINVHDIILSQIGKKYTAESSLINNIADELFSIVVSRFFVNQTMGLGLSQEGYKSLLYGENSTAAKLSKIKSGQLFSSIQDNKLIQSLKTYFDNNNNVPDLVLSYNTQIKEKWDKDDLTSSWGDILTHDDPSIREFGRELMILSFISSGFKRGIYSFFQYIPVTYMKDIGYDSFIGEQLQKLNNTPVGEDALLSYLDDFYKHNWINDNIAPRIQYSDIKDGLNISNDRKQKDASAIAIFKMKNARGKIGKDNKIIDLFLGTNIEGPIYRPYVKLETGGKFYLYKYQGYIMEHNEVRPIYTITNKLGYYNKGNTFKEYGYDTSVFEDNNVNMPDQVRYNILPENISNIGTSNKYENFIEVDAFSKVSNILEIEQNDDFENVEQVELPGSTTQGTYTITAVKWYNKFNDYVKSGYYQKFIKDLKKTKTDNEIENINKQIREVHLEKTRLTHPELGELTLSDDNSTINVGNENILKEKEPTFNRLMVGNHGVYIEMSEPNNKGRFIKKRLQYNEYNRDGVKLYDQFETVNYADYKIGQWYVSIDDILEPDKNIDFDAILKSNTPTITQLEINFEANTAEKKEELQRKYDHCKGLKRK